jgi:Flp pilus assembly protein TadG
MIQSVDRTGKARRSWINSGWRKLRGNGGGSLVELALILGTFFPLLIFGTIEIGGLVYDSIEATEAAHAGAVFVAQSYRSGWTSKNPYPGDAAVANAAEEAAPNIPIADFSGTPTGSTTSNGVVVGCTCGAPTFPLTGGTCSTLPSCSSTDILYVTVQTQAQVSPLIQWSALGLTSPFVMKGQATLELNP